MGLFSKIKKGLKKAWNAVKASVRAVVRVVVEVVMRVINVVTILIPVQRKMRLQIIILRDEMGQPLAIDKELMPALSYAKTTFRDKFGVQIKAYGDPIVQTLPDPAPTAALDVRCDGGAGKDEWGEAGNYFARHLAGWNIIPIHLGFPITVYVVRDVSGKIGCSMGPLTDYVTVDTVKPPAQAINGITSDSTLAHELGHACGLLHRDNDISNLMYPSHGRSNGVTGWQRFVVKTCRHCTLW